MMAYPKNLISVSLMKSLFIFLMFSILPLFKGNSQRQAMITLTEKKIKTKHI